jgi:arylsulfatase
MAQRVADHHRRGSAARVVGRLDGDPPGGPDSKLYLGMNWAPLGSTPFRRFKHFTHEGGIAVPLIAHWPRGIPARRRNALVRDPAGAAYPREFRGQAIQPMEGVSLRPAHRGSRGATTRRRRALSNDDAVRLAHWNVPSPEPGRADSSRSPRTHPRSLASSARSTPAQAASRPSISPTARARCGTGSGSDEI